MDLEPQRIDLTELKAQNLPRGDHNLCVVKISANEPSPEVLLEMEDINQCLDSYYQSFVAIEKGTCPGCGNRLGGLLGTFTWGLVHGEGACSVCRYPCRAYHRPKYKDGSEIFSSALIQILPYHPDDLVKTEEL